MPRVYSKADLIAIAIATGQLLGHKLHNGVMYVARDYETGDDSPAPDRTIWSALDTEALMDLARGMDMLFSTPQEFASYRYMLMQQADRVNNAEHSVLVKYDGGLAKLTDMGIQPHTVGTFVPNYIPYTIIAKESPDYKYVEELLKVMTDWLGSELQARSLLHHLSTALQPGWSAVKYLLLLGEGRNGKGTLLKMLRKLFGKPNISGVQRQQMAAQRPILRDLNGKLINIVMDGPMQYIPESGPEKTIVAGETLTIELKYENEPFDVQTNALFVEALNKEPKARDKSTALQARLVRFEFPNKYEDDLNFLAWMQSDKMISALLTLLWEHWVGEDELASKLKQTEESRNLQVTHIMGTSPVLAFLEELARKDMKIIEQLRSGEYRADNLVDALQPWMHNQGYGDRTITDIKELLGEHFLITKTVKREAGKPVTRHLITGLKAPTVRALEMIESSDDPDREVLEG